jgi:large subunit ribosomal protein L9
MAMEVILTEDVAHLGHIGDLVRVKPGYGRNYLIPNKLAVLATSGNKKELEHQLRQLAEKKERLRASALETANAIGSISVTIARQAGEDDRLFGSVTNRDIEAALAAAGHEVDRRRIILKEPIKALGIYQVPVKLHADVQTNVSVWVAAL